MTHVLTIADGDTYLVDSTETRLRVELNGTLDLDSTLKLNDTAEHSTPTATPTATAADRVGQGSGGTFSYLWSIYATLGAMAVGSAGLYGAAVTASRSLPDSLVEFRVAISAFATIAWALFSLASFNVFTPGGSGDIITQSYPALGFLGFGFALVCGLFLLDSVLKAVNQ